MKRWWRGYAARYDAMRRRERVLLTAAVLLAVGFLMHVTLVAPAATERRNLLARMDKERAQVVAVEGAIREEAEQSAAPQAAREQQEIELRRQLAHADETIRALHRSLVPAGRVPALLREMVARDPALELQSLRTLPTAPLMPAGEKEGTAERGVYKHGVEITVRGNYNALHDYLARLERLPSTLYWWRARLATDDTTTLTMTLTIHTLSLDKAWLEL